MTLDRPLVTGISECARFLRVTPQTVRKWC